MDYFEKSLEHQPDNFHAIYNGATLLFETGQYDLSKEWFDGARNATLKFEEWKLANVGLGAVYEKILDYESAIRLYKLEGFASKLEELLTKLKNVKHKDYEKLKQIAEGDIEDSLLGTDIDEEEMKEAIQESTKNKVQQEKGEIKSIDPVVPKTQRKSLPRPDKNKLEMQKQELAIASKEQV